MNIQDLPDSKISTLTHCLRVAADRFREDAQAFRDLKPQLIQQEQDNPDAMRMIHSSACEPLAEQFELQAREAEQLLEEIQEAAYGD